MNERIKELHTKATEWALDNYPPPVNTFMWEDLRNEKFAELIVRECAKIAWEDSERYATIDNDTIMNGKADVLALCSHHIKEHFGVEE